MNLIIENVGSIIIIIKKNWNNTKLKLCGNATKIKKEYWVKIVQEVWQ